MDVSGKRVFVGLSGGVDSAVSAALLQEAGAQVTGVFIKGWYPPGMSCTWASDRQDAMRVAARLGMPFVTLDASVEYKRGVIDYLLAEYAALRTPNPDVMCNREVKFGAFYRYAKERGADAIATGHYRSGEKDQSYFLALVPRDILAETVFPVGHMDKREVRRLAQRLKLPVAEKKDSQGVCFLGSVSVKEFLRAELGEGAALLHTIGERVDGKYVVGKRDGELVLADAPTPPDAISKIIFRDANWLQDASAIVRAQMRYRARTISGKVAGNAFLPSETFTELPTPGQLIAFYEAGGALAGGGIIESYA